MSKHNFKEKLLDIFYPRHIKCVFCGKELNENADKDTCEECAQTLPFILHACPKCGVKMDLDDEGVCYECSAAHHEFERAVAVFEYTGRVVNLVHNFKYNGCKEFYEPVGEYLCEALAGWEIEPDVVTFVPMTKKRLKTRGFNQAELVARFVAQKFHLPCAQIVDKVQENEHQASLDFATRHENIKGCFAVNEKLKPHIKGATVLLIDDIFTTGSTVNEISKVLKRAGVDKVFVLTFAHTSLRLADPVG